jgi:hypothetical protein
MTDLEKLLAPIESRLNKATPGPWKDAGTRSLSVNKMHVHAVFTNHEHGDWDSIFSLTAKDAELIANAPTDIARLLAAVRRMDKALESSQKIAAFVGACVIDTLCGCYLCKARAEVLAILKGE